jgi:hypothetical protein
VLRRLAAAAPVPVFPAVGAYAADCVANLFLADTLELVVSPLHAALLLLAGEIRPEDADALNRLHDQLPHPRATVCWGEAPFPAFATVECVPWTGDPTLALLAVYRELLSGERPSESDHLPDQPPAPWRGIGEHGQGGQGMMGGTPYGRPMAMTADDLSDGLALDAFEMTVGPFLPTLPAGLVLGLTLQGDVIQQATVVRPPLPPAARDRPSGETPGRRIGRRLRGIARMLDLLELHPLSMRSLSLAREAEAGRNVAIAPLRQAVRRAGVLRAIPPGLGRYASLDARGRLENWLDDAEPNLMADSCTSSQSGTRVSREDLEQLLRGLEWNEAMLVLASFDPPALIAGFNPSKGAEESSA